jgi:hypothetical protein
VTATFRDFDPEDAYDATDPPGVRLDVLERIADALEDDDDRREPRRLDALRLVANLDGVAGVNRRRLRRIRRRLEDLG